MTRPLMLRGARIYTPEGVVDRCDLRISAEGVVEQYGPGLPETPDAAERLLHGRTVIPGLIDLHLHGACGAGVMDCSLESLEQISRFHAAHGTTAFLAGTGAPLRRLEEALGCIAEGMRRGMPGAEMLGCHLEGPFLNPEWKGAFPAEDLQLPTPQNRLAYLEASRETIRLVTLAPEIQHGQEATRFFADAGVTVSIGHSGATFDQVRQAVQNGATHTTHHYNAMGSFHHREPGVIGAGLVLPELTTELICDGVHVHPAAIRLLYGMKGPSRLCLVTDSVFSNGLPDGDYGARVIRGGVTYLAGTDTLAGSRMTMLDTLKNMLRFTGEPLERILPSLTESPAREIGLDQRKGSLHPGKDADFLILDDALNLSATYVKGKPVYQTADLPQLQST